MNLATKICLIIAQLSVLLSPLAFAEPVFEFPRTNSFVLISYNQVIPMIEEQDKQPMLRIFGNGTVRVHFPVYMKKAGDYEMQLSRDELQALLLFIEERGLLQFERSNVATLKKQMLNRTISESKIINIRSDDAFTDIQINLDSYTSSEKSIAGGKVVKRVSWPNLKWEAQQYSAITPLVNAAAIEERLQQLIHHPGLVKIK